MLGEIGCHPEICFYVSNKLSDHHIYISENFNSMKASVVTVLMFVLLLSLPLNILTTYCVDCETFLGCYFNCRNNEEFG